MASRRRRCGALDDLSPLRLIGVKPPKGRNLDADAITPFTVVP